MSEMAEVSPTRLSAPTSARATDDVLLVLDAAIAFTRTVGRLADRNSMGDADRRLRDAVEAARDAGIAWGTIGSKLGMARGNAYQKYRKRPA